MVEVLLVLVTGLGRGREVGEPDADWLVLGRGQDILGLLEVGDARFLFWKRLIIY